MAGRLSECAASKVMLISHQGPSKPMNSVMGLWFEPGGCSVVPRSARAWAIMPAALPMSKLHVLGERVRFSFNCHLGVLADAALLWVDVEETRTALWDDRRWIVVRHTSPYFA